MEAFLVFTMGLLIIYALICFYERGDNGNK